MDKNFDDFLNEIESGKYYEERTDLLNRLYDPIKRKGAATTGSEAAAFAAEYSREISKLTIREYHDWMSRVEE